MGKMRMRFISVLAVIITISQHSNCRKLGGEAHHHHHDDEHSEHHHTEDHHHDNSEDHHHNIHNHVDHQQEIQALESSIESVYASFDGSEDVDYSYNVIEDDSLEELDRSRYSSVISLLFECLELKSLLQSDPHNSGGRLSEELCGEGGLQRGTQVKS